MNTILTGLGIALVLALAAALLAPWFIDWNAYRPMFEARIAAALGVPVRIAGPVSVTLLPTPHLRLTDVRAGRSADQRLAVKALSFDLAITPLLSGRFALTDLRIDQPTLVATVDGNGKALLPFDPARVGGEQLGAISVADVTVADGIVELVDGLTGERRRLTHVSASGSATSLAGPMKLAGQATTDGARYRFRLSTGTFQRSRGSVQLAVTPAGGGPTLDLDGTLAGGAGQPLFTGRAALKPSPDPRAAPGTEPPWQFTGRVTASPRKIVADQLDLQFGAAARALHLNGSAEIDLGPERGIALVLQARQLDLDRARGIGADAPAEPPLAALREFASLLPTLPPPAWPLNASVSVGSVVLGGDLVQDAALSLSAGRGGWTIDRLAMALPGQTRLDLTGAVSATHDGPRFQGDASLDAADLPELLRWLGAKPGRSGIVPVRRFALRGRVTAAPGQVALDDVRVAAGGATLTGRVAWRDQPKPGLAVTLTADRLDVDRLGLPPLVAALGGSREDPFAGIDLDLVLKSQRLAWAGVEASGVDVDLSHRGSRLVIRRLKLADLGGAALDVHGTLVLAGGHPTGDLAASLDARSLDGIVGALRAASVAPSIADAVAARATALAPAHVTLRLSGTAKAKALAVDLSGKLAGTTITADGRIERAELDAPLDARLAAANPDAAALLAQLGVATAPFGKAGAADLRVELSGTPSRGASLDGSATLAGTAFAFDGRLDATRPAAAAARGRLTAAGDDVGPLLVLLGRAPPAALPALPLRLQAEARFDGHGVVLDSLSGALAGHGVGGRLGWRDGVLAGTLKLPRFALADLLGMALGPLAVGEGEGAWPDGPLAPGLLAGLSGKIALACDRFALLPGAVLDGAGFTLALAPGEMGLEAMKGTLAGGTFSGELHLHRIAGQAALSLRAKLDRADLSELAWRRDGGAVATGLVSFSADAQGTGKSLAAIVANLAGGGSATVTGARIPRLDPGAFARVAKAADAMDPIEPAQIAPLTEAELAKGGLDAGTLTSAFTIAGGTLRADVAADTVAATASAHASLALAPLTVAAAIRLAPATAPDGGDAPPEIALRFDGPLAAPRRTLDVTPFTGYLTMRSVEREVKQVEVLEAERRRQEAERAAAAKAEAERQAALAAEKAAEEKAAVDKAAADKAQAEKDAAARAEAEKAAAVRPLPPLAPPREIGRPPGASSPRIVVGQPLDTRPRTVLPGLDSGPRIIVLPRPAVPADNDPIGALIDGRP
ncbi:MAG TPA: AsmA-like C-terminal region-containing protein [Hyphomicrobiales bacterium]|nr:AsmA-like C-terminal region-containing protein [Hyphomicrobiales bacterium]